MVLTVTYYILVMRQALELLLLVVGGPNIVVAVLENVRHSLSWY